MSFITASTYQELDAYTTAFAQGTYHLLIIEGSGGLAKSRLIGEAMHGQDYLYLASHATARGMYEQLYLHRYLPVVIDDLDGIYRDADAVRLLKALCSTDDVKTLQWHRTLSKRDTESGIPLRFQSCSHVCIIPTNGAAPTPTSKP